MAEFEWEQTAERKEVADLLRGIANGLAKGGEVKLERDSWELKLNVPEKLEIEIELETGEGETELEIELKWSDAKPAPKQQGKGGGSKS